MTTVELVNPLPGALDHYAEAVRFTLEAAGTRVVSVPTTSAERHGTGRGAAFVLVECLRDRLVRPGPPSGTHRLVLWPVLGYPELTMWRGRASRTSVVIHDPTPLRRQVGLGRAASGVTRVLGAVRGTRRLVVHSAAARDEVVRRGFAADLLPLPILRPEPADPAEGSRRVLVLGQHKDARDLGLLSGLGGLLRERGMEPHIVGRGWPPVPGWEVDPRFVSDEEFRALIGSSALVLLPYTKVYQSDVAIRAAELGVPVVGAADTNVPDLYGGDWPGLVTGGNGRPATPADWAAAVDRAREVGADDVLRRVAAYWTSAQGAWQDWASRL